MGSVFSKPDTPDIPKEKQTPPKKQKKPLKQQAEDESKKRKKMGVRSLTIPMGGAENGTSGVGIPKG